MPMLPLNSRAEQDRFIQELRDKGLDVTYQDAAPLEVPQASPKPSKGKAKPKSQPVSLNVSAKIQALWMPHWHPARLNQIMHGHWSNGARLKKRDKAAIGLAWALTGGRPASSPRRLDMHLILEKGKRAGDIDSYWKSPKDALKHCGALIEDNRQWCKDGQITFSRAEDGVWGTLILLTDVDG